VDFPGLFSIKLDIIYQNFPLWSRLKKKGFLHKNKDTYGIHPTKFASSTQKHKKIIETPNQPIEIKKTPIKVCFVP
jgi:hypothetical protein